MVGDVTDENQRRHTRGLIALELYTRNTNNAATFLQFDDLKLKKPSGSSTSVTSSTANLSKRETHSAIVADGRPQSHWIFSR